MIFGKKNGNTNMGKKNLAKLALAGIIAGGFAMVACEHTTTGASAENQTTLAKFKADCEATPGRTYQAIATCTGHSECAGESFDVGKGTKTSHDCKGKNTCAGGTCLDSTKKVMTAADSLKANQAALAKFKADCEATPGRTYEAIAACTGTSKCAGESFNVGTGIKTSQVCAGHNTCAGGSCLDPTKKV